jgi:hypothetical protein
VAGSARQAPQAPVNPEETSGFSYYVST